MCLFATSRTNSHATVSYPLFTRGMSTTLLPECLTPMLLLTFSLHWMVYIPAWSLQWNFLLRIRSLSSVYWRPCCIVPMPCHLRQKPLMRNALRCALYSPDLIIQLDMFILSKPEKKIDDVNTIRIVLPFKDLIAANAVRRQLRNLSRKICVTLQTIFVSKPLEQDLKPKEIKPSIVNRQCVVYKFACDLCDADYVGYTARHLHQRIAEHKYSSIGKHLLEAHDDKNLLFVFSRSATGNLTASFTRCYSSKNWSLALTLRVTPSVLNSLFSL